MCITEKKTNKSSYPEPHAQTHIFPLQQTKSRGGGHVLHKQTHTTKHDSIKASPWFRPRDAWTANQAVPPALSSQSQYKCLCFNLSGSNVPYTSVDNDLYSFTNHKGNSFSKD